MAEIDVLSRFGSLHYKIATIHLAEGRHDAAIRCIREAAHWHLKNVPEALTTIAMAAQQTGVEAYRDHDMEKALACWRAAREAAPGEEAVQGLGRAVATLAHNVAVRAVGEGRIVAAAEAFLAAHELDPDLAASAAALPGTLRDAAAACFADGRPLEGLHFVERLSALAAGREEDAALLHSVGAWLRDNFVGQVRTAKAGAAVLLLQRLARLDSAALAEPAIAESIAALTDMLAQHADVQPVEVLNAVLALHAICPSPKLSWAGAAAYNSAMTEARRLHVAGELMPAVALCEPATRYRPRGQDRQLPHVLATLLCRRVQDLLEEDRAGALALHERVLALLDAYRSQGIAAS